MAPALLLFLCSGLVFAVQPLAGHEVLPRFGGSASVWIVCLVVFQALHASASFYAHLLLRRLSGRRALALHAVLAILVLFAVPVLASPSSGASAGPPTWVLVRELVARFGGPFLLLAGTIPLVIEWRRRVTGDVAHGLYRASNLGSFAGLLFYVGVVEPGWDTTAQSLGWFAGLTLAVFGFASWCVRERAAHPHRSIDPPAGRLRWQWITHPCLASVLMAATTAHLTRDVAPVPLLWVAPLALFLLAFTIAFDPRTARFATVLRYVAVGATIAAVGLLVLEAHDRSPGMFLQAGVFLLALAAGVASITNDLYLSRPVDCSATGFYLAIAVAGTTGSALVAFVAPLVFSDAWELHLALLCLALVLVKPRLGGLRQVAPGWAALALVTAGLTIHVGLIEAGTLEARRGFFGVLRVVSVGDGSVRTLVHGRIDHGRQLTDPEHAGKATAYYGAGTGVALAIEEHPAREDRALRVGVVGLGVGTLAAWSRPGDELTFYEIDSNVVDLACAHFTYLDQAQGEVEIVEGDARITLRDELASDGSRGYDVLVLDAFSGDAVPAHLLTVEAFELYRAHLAPDGILAVHTSNRYLALAPVVEAAADELGWRSLRVETDGDAFPAGEYNEWTLLTRNASFLGQPELLEQVPAVRRAPSEENRWTDSRVRLLRALLYDALGS